MDAPPLDRESGATVRVTYNVFDRGLSATGSMRAEKYAARVLKSAPFEAVYAVAADRVSEASRRTPADSKFYYRGVGIPASIKNSYTPPVMTAKVKIMDVLKEVMQPPCGGFFALVNENLTEVEFDVVSRDDVPFVENALGWRSF